MKLEPSIDRSIPDEVLRFAMGEVVPENKKQFDRMEQKVEAALKLLTLSSSRRRWDSTPSPMGTRMAVIERAADGARRQKSLLRGTIFAHTHVPLSIWFRALGLFVAADDGISARRMRQELDIGSYQTALSMLNAIRGLLSRLQPGMTGAVQKGSLMPTDIWPRIGGEEGSDSPIWIIMETRHPMHRVRILYEGTATDLPGVMMGWDYPTEKDMPSECREVSGGLVAWLQKTHRRRPRLNKLQPYLDEYAFRFNIRKQRRRREVLMALIRVAAGESPVDPFIPIVTEHIPTVGRGARLFDSELR